MHAAALLGGCTKDDVVPATEILHVLHEQLLAKGLCAGLIEVLHELAAETRRLWRSSAAHEPCVHVLQVGVPARVTGFLLIGCTDSFAEHVCSIVDLAQFDRELSELTLEIIHILAVPVGRDARFEQRNRDVQAV